MLVLTRRPGESIIIGKDIQITLLGYIGTGNSRIARIGVEAPADVPVDRTEIRRRKDLGLPPPEKKQ